MKNDYKVFQDGKLIFGSDAIEQVKEFQSKLEETTEKIKQTFAKEDVVNHPSHYTSGKIEVIDFITDQKLDFALGNVVKYVARAGKKHEDGMKDLDKTIQDLEKAQFYLRHKIKVLKKMKEHANKNDD